jgi:membrane associated rhomboid family serine protease
MSDAPPPLSQDDPDAGGAASERPTPPREPLFNALPGVVLVLAAIILAVQLAESLSFGRGGSVHALIYWAGALRTGAAVDAFPPAPLFGLSPYILHVFVHAGWAHLLINLGVLLAVGPAVRRPFGPGLRGDTGFLVFFFACAIGGAVLHQITHLTEATTMAGASTAISGLIAAAGWARGGRTGMYQLALPWLGLNLALALVNLVFPVPIAWAGHVGGLLVGMLAYPVCVRILGARRRV